MARAKIGVEFDPVVTAKVDRELARLQSQAKGIDFGGGARSLNKLSRPLGKITGQANEFQKSLEASNARVLAFGASVVVINKLSEAFSGLLSNTIKVEATFAKINTILGGTEKQLKQFGDGIFLVAKRTATGFEEVAEGALELARQGLSVEESLSRVETALKLVRVAGIDSQQAVAGLTAAIKGFENAGLTVAQIGDKLAEVDTKFAVSTEDLINGLERASASARVAGVSFDELLAAVTTVQERTQRGGAVIGNAFKTIFARLGRTDTLQQLEALGITTLDASGNVRNAVPLFRELATELDKLGLRSVEAGQVIQKVAGVRQRDILINLIEDLNSEQSKFNQALVVSANSVGALDQKNKQLNETLQALIQNLITSSQQLAATLGNVGFLDAAKGIVDGFSAVVNKITEILDGEGIGSKFARGLVDGIGKILTGPGLGLALAIFTKLFLDLAKFGVQSLKSLLGINAATERQKALQDSVLQSLMQNEGLQRAILNLEGNKVAQEQLLLRVYNQQVAAMTKLATISKTVTPGLYGKGLRGGPGGITGKASGGYIASERRDVNRGVGGATSAAQVVSIPNFAFGGGKRGTMIANTSEYIVPNYAGGGDAIFNQNMVKSMGLPPGARKITAAGGYVPNFIKPSQSIRKAGITSPEAARQAGYSESQIANAFGAQGTRAKARATAASKKQAGIFNADTAGIVMLVPQRGVSGADISMNFQKPRKGRKGTYTGFVGSAYGISNNLQNNKRFKNISNIDNELEGSMAESINNIVQKIYPSIKTTPTPPITPEIAKDKFLREGGAGAFGAFKGAMFEAIIEMITGGSRKDRAGTLDVKFGGGNRAALNTIFGLPTGMYDDGDYKSSMLQKSKFATQAIKARGAGGYIPNYFGGGDPLQSAILREQAAGVPINQIRINQSGKLRNSKNPGGLAVTNTRDEPTGAIPNFVAFAPVIGGLMNFLFGATFVDSIQAQFTGVSGLEYVINKLTEAFGDLDEEVRSTRRAVAPLSEMSFDQLLTRKVELEGAQFRLRQEGNVQQAAFMQASIDDATSRLTGYRGSDKALTGRLTRPAAVQQSTQAIQSIINQRQMESDALVASLRQQIKLNSDLTNQERVKAEFEIKREQQTTSLNKLKFEGLQTVLKETLSAKDLENVDQERLKTILSMVDENTNFVGLQKTLSDEFGISSENAEKILLNAENLTYEYGQQLLISNSQLSTAERLAMEEARRADALKESNKLIRQMENSMRRQQSLSRAQFGARAAAIGRPTEFNRGARASLIADQRDFDISALNQQEEILYSKYEKTVAARAAGEATIEDVQESFKDYIAFRQEKIYEITRIEANAFADIDEARMTSLQKYTQENARFIANFNSHFATTSAQAFEQSMNQALDDIADGTADSIGEALGNAAISFGRALLKELQSRQVKAATNALFGDGGSQGGGIFSTIGQGIKNFFTKKNSGGIITGGGGVIDDVPAMLTGGEYVIRKSAVQKYGVDFLNSLNSGNIQGYNQGGPVYSEQDKRFTTAEEAYIESVGGGVQGADNIRTTRFFLYQGEGLFGRDHDRKADLSQMFGGAASNERLARARGMDLFMPGDRGFGAIVGKENLLAFSQQRVTSGATDFVGQGRINLELQSARLSPLGRRLAMESPAGQRLREAQGQAYELAMESAAAEQFVVDQNQQARTARREAFQSSVKNAVISAAVNVGIQAGAEALNNTQFMQNMRARQGARAEGASGISNVSNAPQSVQNYMAENIGVTSQIYDGVKYSRDYTGKTTMFNRRDALGGMSSGGNSLLSQGEFVVSKDASSAMGEDTLDSINQMRFAQGGSMGSIPRSGSSSANSKADVENINITINIDKEGNTEASTDIEGDAQRSKEFSKKVKDVVLNVINEEKRVSGSLFTRNK